ncbi:hypothetical protein, partial [Flavobacterium sp.]|uniref:hypothetical protein n=1 Tax=Flavobacterium sp. TaxID=239 RepID=UPI0028BD92AE
IVLERLESDSAIYNDDADIQKLYKRYYKKLKNLVNYYNNNKVSILSNDYKFNACYMKITGLISDYNNAFKQIKN